VLLVVSAAAGGARRPSSQFQFGPSLSLFSRRYALSSIPSVFLLAKINACGRTMVLLRPVCMQPCTSSTGSRTAWARTPLRPLLPNGACVHRVSLVPAGCVVGASMPMSELADDEGRSRDGTTIFHALCVCRSAGLHGVCVPVCVWCVCATSPQPRLVSLPSCVLWVHSREASLPLLLLRLLLP
jgi:hypothetical protein